MTSPSTCALDPIILLLEASTRRDYDYQADCPRLQRHMIRNEL